MSAPHHAEIHRSLSFDFRPCTPVSMLVRLDREGMPLMRRGQEEGGGWKPREESKPEEADRVARPRYMCCCTIENKHVQQ